MSNSFCKSKGSPLWMLKKKFFKSSFYQSHVMAFGLTIPKWYNTWVLQIFFVNIWSKIFFKRVLPVGPLLVEGLNWWGKVHGSRQLLSKEPRWRTQPQDQLHSDGDRRGGPQWLSSLPPNLTKAFWPRGSRRKKLISPSSQGRPLR